MNPTKRAEMIQALAEDLAANVRSFESVKYAYNTDAHLAPDALDPRAGYEMDKNALNTVSAIERQILHLRQCLLTLQKEL